MRPKINLRVAMGLVNAITATEMTFAELVEAYCAVNCDEADYYTRKFMDVFGSQSAWTISSADLSAATEAMLASGIYRPASINRNTSAIGSIYRWAKKRRLSPAGHVVGPAKAIKPA